MWHARVTLAMLIYHLFHLTQDHHEFKAFLSGVDLHTQLLYQQHFPETIAVVLSQKYPQTTNAYRIKDDAMRTVLRCRREGLEHLCGSLEQSQLFEVADHVIDTDTIVEFIDDRLDVITDTPGMQSTAKDPAGGRTKGTRNRRGTCKET